MQTFWFKLLFFFFFFYRLKDGEITLSYFVWYFPHRIRSVLSAAVFVLKVLRLHRLPHSSFPLFPVWGKRIQQHAVAASFVFFFKPPLCSEHFERFLSKEPPSSWPLLPRRHVIYYVLVTCRPGNQVNEVYQVESWKKEKDGKIYVSEQIERRVNVAGCWCCVALLDFCPLSNLSVEQCSVVFQGNSTTTVQGQIGDESSCQLFQTLEFPPSHENKLFPNANLPCSAKG